MNRLWAPWRRKFLAHPKPKGCIFCVLPKSQNDRKNLIVERGDTVFSMLNLYPYNNGHVLISPYRHLASPELMTEGEWAELFHYVKRSKAALDRILKPHGYNMGMNVGAAAGAGFDKHVHFHLVPRWGGDTNFMPVVGGQKVISESLDELWKRLVKDLR